MKDSHGERACCATCNFYQDPPAGQTLGSCHESSIRGALVPGPGGRPQVLSFFPDVTPDNFCGKHDRDGDRAVPTVELVPMPKPVAPGPPQRPTGLLVPRAYAR